MTTLLSKLLARIGYGHKWYKRQLPNDLNNSPTSIGNPILSLHFLSALPHGPRWLLKLRQSHSTPNIKKKEGTKKGTSLPIKILPEVSDASLAKI